MRRLWNRLKMLLRRTRQEQELQDEIAAHLNLDTQERIEHTRFHLLHGLGDRRALPRICKKENCCGGNTCRSERSIDDVFRLLFRHGNTGDVRLMNSRSPRSIAPL